MNEQPVYEFKHITCAPHLVQRMIDLHSIFFWEVQGTDSSSSSYLAREGDTIYSVVERTTNLNLRRNKNIPHIQTIKVAETEYFNALNRFDWLDTRGWTLGRICLAAFAFTFYVVPGVLYVRHINKKTKNHCAEKKMLEAKLTAVIRENAAILNLPDGYLTPRHETEEVRAFKVEDRPVKRKL